MADNVDIHICHGTPHAVHNLWLCTLLPVVKKKITAHLERTI